MDILAGILLLSGGGFVLVAGLGILRMPDVYIRMHASTKAGTLGLALICGALMLTADSWWQVIEAGFVTAFMLATAPIGAHLIGRAAYRAGVPFLEGTKVEAGCEEFGPPPLTEVNMDKDHPAHPM